LKRHTADTVQTCEIGRIQAISCDSGRRKSPARVAPMLEASLRRSP